MNEEEKLSKGWRERESISSPFLPTFNWDMLPFFLSNEGKNGRWREQWGCKEKMHASLMILERDSLRDLSFLIVMQENEINQKERHFILLCKNSSGSSASSYSFPFCIRLERRGISHLLYLIFCFVFECFRRTCLFIESSFSDCQSSLSLARMHACLHVSICFSL